MTRFYVLMPTHNRAQLLERAVASVRAQSYSNWDLFILDDGSHDSTSDVLSRFAEDPKIHCTRFESNRGVNPARNELLEQILQTGEPGFVVILDDDDTLEKDALAHFSEAARDNPKSKWLIANCHFPNGDRVSQFAGGYRPLCYVRDHKLGNQLSGDVAHVFHTDLIGDTRFIDRFPNAEEWWFYADLAKKSKMHPLDFHAKTIDYLEDGLTRIQPNKDQSARIYALKLERFDSFLGRADRASLEARLGRHLFAIGDRREGIRKLSSAFTHWPFEFRIYTYALEILASPLLRFVRLLREPRT